MKPLLVITHVDRAVVGLLDEVASQCGHLTRIARPYRGETLPDLADVEAVVTLGGPQSAYDAHEYLRAEEGYLAAAVTAEIPVLAICLGSQVLARALGGSAEPGPVGLEAGMIHVAPPDPASAGITGEFFSFHSDTMTPPDSAEVLATSERYVQAWTAGSALAVQFHPEMTAAGVDGLLRLEGPKLQHYGIDVVALRRDAERYFRSGAQASQKLLHTWLDRAAIAPRPD